MKSVGCVCHTQQAKSSCRYSIFDSCVVVFFWCVSTMLSMPQTPMSTRFNIQFSEYVRVLLKAIFMFRCHHVERTNDRVFVLEKAYERNETKKKQTAESTTRRIAVSLGKLLAWVDTSSVALLLHFAEFGSIIRVDTNAFMSLLFFCVLSVVCVDCYTHWTCAHDRFPMG